MHNLKALIVYLIGRAGAFKILISSEELVAASMWNNLNVRLRILLLIDNIAYYIRKNLSLAFTQRYRDLEREIFWEI